MNGHVQDTLDLRRIGHVGDHVDGAFTLFAECLNGGVGRILKDVLLQVAADPAPAYRAAHAETR